MSVHIQCQATIYTLSLCRGHSWRLRLAKQETLTPPGHLVSPLVCRGPWMSTVVLYCWCHSDSASVLLYFISYSHNNVLFCFISENKNVCKNSPVALDVHSCNNYCIWTSISVMTRPFSAFCTFLLLWPSYWGLHKFYLKRNVLWVIWRIIYVSVSAIYNECNICAMNYINVCLFVVLMLWGSCFNWQ